MFSYRDYPALRISSTAPSGIPSYGNPHHDYGSGGASKKKA
jgi:hypothetical protein